MREKVREGFLVLGFFLVVLAAFFYPAVFQGQLIYSGDCSGSDLLELNVPRRALVAQAVAEGEMPLWEPRLGNGLPLLAEGQAGTFYPLTLPLYLLGSITTATNLSIILTLLIALTGVYVWARVEGASVPAALLGGLAYGLGGAFIFRLKHLNMVEVIAWLPWSLALVRMLWARPRLSVGLFLGAIWSFQLLAGHPHVTYICWLACALYALTLIGWVGENKRNWQIGSKYVGCLFACIFLALLLSAVQLAPNWELVQSSNRAAPETWEGLAKYPFLPEHLLRLIMPYSSGNPADGTYIDPITTKGVFWESTPYLGILPLILAVWALYKRRQPSTYAVAGLSLLFLVSALGPRGLVYWIFWKFFPAFALFRFPARMLIPFLCFSALLAAWGIQEVEAWVRSRFSVKAAQITVVAIVALTVLDLGIVNSAYQGYLPAEWEQVPASYNTISSTAQRVYAPTYFFSWNDLAKQGWKNNGPQLLRHLQLLNPDLAAIWGVRCHSDRIVYEGGVELSSYFGMQCWEFSQIVEGLRHQDKLSVSNTLLDWLRLQNVSHLTSFIPILNAENNINIASTSVLRPANGLDNPIYVYALRNPLPLVHLVPQKRVVPGMPEPARSIRENLPTVFAESLYEILDDTALDPKAAVIKEQKRTSITVETNSSESSYVVLAYTYDKNWHCCDELGQDLPIVRINQAYQAVLLTPGQHILTFTYRSPAFAWGWKLSLVVWLGWLGMLLWTWRSSKRNVSADEAG